VSREGSAHHDSPVGFRKVGMHLDLLPIGCKKYHSVVWCHIDVQFLLRDGEAGYLGSTT
jgi:hypothetical protein